jgi:hypothetical protein
VAPGAAAAPADGDGAVSGGGWGGGRYVTGVCGPASACGWRGIMMVAG